MCRYTLVWVYCIWCIHLVFVPPQFHHGLIAVHQRNDFVHTQMNRGPCEPTCYLKKQGVSSLSSSKNYVARQYMNYKEMLHST
jgi:hypothetical protein